MLFGAQLFGFGAELVAPEFADDHLEPPPRLFRLSKRDLVIGERGLRLRQKRLQPGILCGQGSNIHALLQSQIGRPHHGEEYTRVISPHLNRQAVANGAAPAAPAAFQPLVPHMRMQPRPAQISS